MFVYALVVVAMLGGSVVTEVVGGYDTPEQCQTSLVEFERSVKPKLKPEVLAFGTSCVKVGGNNRKATLMTPDLEDYYNNRFEMMGTAGWRELLEDVAVFEAGINQLDGIEKLEDLYFRKGQLDMIRWLKSLKSISETTYEHLKNESSE